MGLRKKSYIVEEEDDSNTASSSSSSSLSCPSSESDSEEIDKQCLKKRHRRRNVRRRHRSSGSKKKTSQYLASGSSTDKEPENSGLGRGNPEDDADINNVKGDVHGPRKNKAELGDDDQLFVGPPPPAVVNEVQSSNEAERFEEVTRIMEAEDDSPYDILGVNKNTSDDKMKKRYWKLSLMVHPDKCTHPQAHQAFIKLNKAHKYLKDADKRKALDEKINLKEQEENRKPGGMPMHSTTFSWNFKEWRRDASAWMDIPMQHVQKAKMNHYSYFKAYNEATPLASNEEYKKKANSEAALVDRHNRVKRSKTLVEQHRESTQDNSKNQSKQEPTKVEWEGSHPRKPWDREKDLTAGKKSVKLDPGSMSQGLTSMFASRSFQRSFL